MELIPFDGDEIEAYWDDEGKEIRVAMKRLCENMGLDWKSQYKKLRKDEVFSAHLSMVFKTTEIGQRESISLPLRLIPAYFMTVVPGRAKPELRPKMVRYKEQAADVLAQHFLGIAPRQAFTGDGQSAFTTVQMEALGRGAAYVMKEYVPPMIDEKIQPLKDDIANRVTREEAEEIANKIVKEALAAEREAAKNTSKEHTVHNGVTQGKLTLLMYLDDLGQSAFAPTSWQDWIRFYDIASLIESPELSYNPKRKWPLRWYSRPTFAKAWSEFLRGKRHHPGEW